MYVDTHNTHMYAYIYDHEHNAEEENNKLYKIFKFLIYKKFYAKNRK